MVSSQRKTPLGNIFSIQTLQKEQNGIRIKSAMENKTEIMKVFGTKLLLSQEVFSKRGQKFSVWRPNMGEEEGETVVVF